jgi:hypothetical protein
VLENALQSGKGILNKWEYRSRVGIYLGHGRNVALVLDRTTGFVSPQFHVKLDPTFRTVKEDEFNQLWQKKAGFLADRMEAKVSKNTSKESIYAKRPVTKPEGASDLPTKKHKQDNPNRWRTSQHSSARGRGTAVTTG